jgi:hypothetical protein
MYDETISEALRVKLSKLGTISDEVAAALTELNCTGRPNSSSSCPIANYLRKHLGWDDVSVGLSTAIVFDDEANVARVPLSAAVRHFVARFDLNAYPALIAPLND